jgi:hypothetical protein
MPSPYQRYYANHGIVAYARSGDPKDHLFVFAGPAGAPASYPSLTPLLAAWSSAGGNPNQRALLFCQAFDTTTLPGLLDQLVTSGTIAQFWGKLAYWRDKTFAGSAFTGLFPDASPGSRVLAEVGGVRLRLESGRIPKSLSDFTIAASAQDKDLTLKLAAGGAAWSVDGVASSAAVLTVALDAGSGYAAGSIGLDIPWTATNHAGSHPLERTQIAYVAPPVTLPQPGDDAAQSQVWRARVVHKVIPSAGSGAFCAVHIDPRDDINAPRWLADQALNSRILFGDAEIHSTFFSATGDRFHLTATKGAAARVGFLYDLMDADQTPASNGGLVFHPEGLFAIKSAAPVVTASAAAAAADLNIARRDFVAGSATTEFFDLGAEADVTHIEFVARQPALLRRDETSSSPIDRMLLDDGKGAVVTSHVRFAKAGTPTDVKFHSQSAEAPLFVAPPVANPDHLRRRRKEYGLAQKPLPVFPHAGYLDGADSYDDFARFELSHLAQYRRKHAPPASPPGDGPPHLAAAAAATELAVTPQGILAEVAADGTSYARLYFGNPDSADNTKIDFALTINNTEARIFRDFQQALLSHQLFIVLRKPRAAALNVVTPSATLYARAPFAFKILATDAGPFTDTSMLADAILFKYYKGKSIAALLADQATWACQPDLAPEGNSKLDTWSPFPKGQPVPYHLKRLKEVWDDKDWQGVLVLNFPLSKQPSLIEALKPGLAKKDDDKEPELRAPYFGLNALPATKTDLTSDPASPHRPGSAFGMIRYAQKEVGKEPDKPTTDDVEPGTSGDGGREYHFVVDSLQITFENSQIADFSARLFIHFSHLFWDSMSSTGALQKLELDGYYERRGKEDIFSLVTPSPLVVTFHDSYLKQLTITRAQLGVVASDDKQLTAFIGIDGTLQLSEKIPQIPLFSVKQIRLSSFGFEYSFARPKLSGFKFRFKPSGISADIDFGAVGAPSLLSLLPVKLKGMSIALGQLLDLGDLHFSPISFGGLGTKFQFGFLMELDFGSLGQLAGDLRGMKLPMLIGWGGGSSKGLAFGIQFPTREGKGIDIGIQQFIRLRAKELNLKVCKDTHGNTQMLAIQAVNARILMLGKEWPEADTSFAIFIPVDSGRKPSWAFGLKKGSWYVGGGYRLKLPSASAKDIKGVVRDFEGTLSDVGGGQDVCSLVSQAASANDNWSVVGRYAGELKVAVAISDPTVYGIAVEIPPFGELDVMYRRVNSQLGIFSIEYTLPGALRTMQIGVATVRLPVFRLEIHTDGGFLADFGFPWNNDFSRSCQVEIAIFLGSGGFYYGVTSAAAADLLTFDGGYGFFAPDSSKLNELRTLRLGFAARVGIGRSFTIGILYAEASVTVFGGLEGAIAYRPGADLFSPTLYALKGYVGLMLDIRATVNFSIIRASAHIVAYVEVGFEIRRVLGKDASNKHHILTLPIVIFAEIALNVGVDVQIHIGCVDITIHLSFSTTWHYEEALTGFKDEGTYDAAGLTATTTPMLLAAPLALTFSWNPAYRYWEAARDINLYATVLPCIASAADVGESGGVKTCAVGTMLLQVDTPDNAFADLARFLVGWVLLPPGTSPAAIDATVLTLGAVDGVLKELRKTDTGFWNGFAAALLAIVPLQFVARLKTLASGQTDIFATLPLWPGVSFRYAPIGGGPATAGTPAVVTDRQDHRAMAATDAAFAEYCRHLIAATIPEIGRLIEDKGYVRNTDGTVIPNASLPRKDSRKSMNWAEAWQQMFASL